MDSMFDDVFAFHGRDGKVYLAEFFYVDGLKRDRYVWNVLEVGKSCYYTVSDLATLTHS